MQHKASKNFPFLGLFLFFLHNLIFCSRVANKNSLQFSFLFGIFSFLIQLQSIKRERRKKIFSNIYTFQDDLNKNGFEQKASTNATKYSNSYLSTIVRFVSFICIRQCRLGWIKKPWSFLCCHFFLFNLFALLCKWVRKILTVNLTFYQGNNLNDSSTIS